ncbi:MAG: tol-pal system-associated acyl-CoA thioesterase [Hyphomonadaceae bacterium]|nr:tol-pal system-associated acyl-CoA thioesterase [Hyphomonadaceae bacterium]
MSDAPTAGRIDGRLHLLPVRIYYEDTDFSGVVYHANYLRYFERGRSDFLRLAGVGHSALLEGDSPTAFAVNRMTLDFLKPARIDDALVVQTEFAAVRGPRLHFAQTLLRGDAIMAQAQVEACCIALTGRPKKPPPALLAALKPFVAQGASTF